MAPRHAPAATADRDAGDRRGDRAHLDHLATAPAAGSSSRRSRPASCSAVTNFIATDLVSAPLLWVIPLAIYLGVVHRRLLAAWRPPRAGWPSLAAPAMVTLLWVPYGSAGGWPILAILVIELVASRRSSRSRSTAASPHDRPDPDHLTEFYLSSRPAARWRRRFVALIAPQVFPDVWEYPILLVGALVALAVGAHPPCVSARRPGARSAWTSARSSGASARASVRTVVGGRDPRRVLVVTRFVGHAESPVRWLVVGGLILARRRSAVVPRHLDGLVLSSPRSSSSRPVEFQARSFFGVTEVLRPADGNVAILMNGTTVHGTQSPIRAPPASRGPTTGRPARPATSSRLDGGPAATATNTSRSWAWAPARSAAYADAGRQMTFFEIDPVVIAVAEDPRPLQLPAPTRRAPPRIVHGDARLSLARRADAVVRPRVLDAFSSDAIPIHLMTIEAITERSATLGPMA